MSVNVFADVIGKKIDDTEFIIEKERKNLLPEVSRFFEKAPFIQNSSINKSFEYNFIDIPSELDILSRKPILFCEQQNLAKEIFTRYIKLGYGINLSPLAEFIFDKQYKSRYMYGLYCKHYSFGTNKYFENSENNVMVHGKILSEEVTFQSALGYDRNIHLCEIFNKSNINNIQNLNLFKSNFSMENSFATKIYYNTSIGYDFLQIERQANEHLAKIKVSGNYKINDLFTIANATSIYISKYNPTSGGKQRNLFYSAPSLLASFDDLHTECGFGLAYQNDNSTVVKPFNLYPILGLRYDLTTWLQPYIKLSGDMHMRSLSYFIKENPRVVDNLNLQHAHQPVLLNLGILGTAFNSVDYNAGVNIARYYNMHFFVNDKNDPGKFNLEYDSTSLTNPFCEIIFKTKKENNLTSLRGDYFSYKMDHFSKPWHKPKYQVELLNHSTLHKRLLLKSRIYWIRGIEAIDIETNEEKQLADVIDLDFGINYLWGTKLYFFIDFKNLLARSNINYINTPKKPLMFIAGLSYLW